MLRGVQLRLVSFAQYTSLRCYQQPLLGVLKHRLLIPHNFPNKPCKFQLLQTNYYQFSLHYLPLLNVKALLFTIMLDRTNILHLYLPTFDIWHCYLRESVIQAVVHSYLLNLQLMLGHLTWMAFLQWFHCSMLDAIVLISLLLNRLTQYIFICDSWSFIFFSVLNGTIMLCYLLSIWLTILVLIQSDWYYSVLI